MTFLSDATQKAKAFGTSLWNADDKTLRWVLGLLIVALACFNFLRDLNQPNHAYWDEAYYATAAQRYDEHTAQYASHPPLGFMFMTLGMQATGANKNLDVHPLATVKKIDQQHQVPDGYDFTGIRLPGALFSVAGALLFYLIILRLSGEAFEAFVFSLLFVFENAWIVHFRAAHLDPFQMTFTLGSILVWLHTYDREPKRPLLTYALFGLLCGLSFMVKVNSLVMVCLAALSLVRAIWIHRSKESIRQFFSRGSAAAAAFIFAVVAVFTLHVYVNPVAPDPSTPSGEKDLKYMGATYKAYLAHERPISPAVVLDATEGYYNYMKHDFVGEIKTEANGSPPIEWPFMERIINYRWDFDGTRTAYTQEVGNLFSWGLALAGLVGSVVILALKRSRREDDPDTPDIVKLEAIFVMYMIFWLFHIYLGSQRVMYIYHYFIGLALSFMLVPLVFKIAARHVPLIEKHRFSVLCAISVGIAVSFFWLSPLTYHVGLTRAQCEAKNWPVQLVICQPVKKK